MCLAAISITSEREQAVDFSQPFKQKRFNILMTKPEEKTSVFQFIWPLSGEVWALTTTAIVVVGLLLHLMDRMNPNSIDPLERYVLLLSALSKPGQL